MCCYQLKNCPMTFNHMNNSYIHKKSLIVDCFAYIILCLVGMFHPQLYCLLFWDYFVSDYVLSWNMFCLEKNYISVFSARTWVAEHFSADPAHFMNAKLNSVLKHCSSILFSVPLRVVFHYDYNIIIAFAHAKFVLLSLKITQAPKLSLSSIVSWYYSLKMIATV